MTNRSERISRIRDADIKWFGEKPKQIITMISAIIVMSITILIIGLRIAQNIFVSTIVIVFFILMIYVVFYMIRLYFVAKKQFEK